MSETKVSSRWTIFLAPPRTGMSVCPVPVEYLVHKSSVLQGIVESLRRKVETSPEGRAEYSAVLALRVGEHEAVQRRLAECAT